MRCFTLLGMIVLFSGCAAIFRDAATHYIWQRWGRIKTISAKMHLEIAGFSKKMETQFYYRVPEQIRVSFDQPQALAGSALVFNRGTFAAYNAIDKTAVRVIGVPLFKRQEKHDLVKSFLSKGYGNVTYEKVGKEEIAGRRSAQYRVTLLKPFPHVQWIWLDTYYLFPLKVVFTDPHTQNISQGWATSIVFNEGVDPKMFQLRLAKEIPLIDFDLRKLDESIATVMPQVAHPYRYLGTVEDAGGSGWKFADYSARPHVFYVIYAKKPKVKFPMTGFVQKFLDQGQERYSIPIRGYSLVSFKQGEYEVIMMANTSYEDLLAMTQQPLVFLRQDSQFSPKVNSE